MKAAGMFDPTGLISAAAAYTYPLCAMIPGVDPGQVDAGKCDCKYAGDHKRDCGRHFTGEADGVRSHCTAQLSKKGCEGRKNVWGQRFCSWTWTEGDEYEEDRYGPLRGAKNGDRR